MSHASHRARSLALGAVERGGIPTQLSEQADAVATVNPCRDQAAVGAFETDNCDVITVLESHHLYELFGEAVHCLATAKGQCCVGSWPQSSLHPGRPAFGPFPNPWHPVARDKRQPARHTVPGLRSSHWPRRSRDFCERSERMSSCSPYPRLSMPWFSDPMSTSLPVTVKITLSQILVTRSAVRSRLCATHSR